MFNKVANFNENTLNIAILFIFVLFNNNLTGKLLTLAGFELGPLEWKASPDNLTTSTARLNLLPFLHTHPSIDPKSFEPGVMILMGAEDSTTAR